MKFKATGYEIYHHKVKAKRIGRRYQGLDSFIVDVKNQDWQNRVYECSDTEEKERDNTGHIRWFSIEEFEKIVKKFTDAKSM